MEKLMNKKSGVVQKQLSYKESVKIGRIVKLFTAQ